MKQIISFFFICFILSGGITSCEREKNPSPDMGYNYFPEQIGKYVVYDVDSFYYNDFNVPVTIDTFRFQIKEKIQSVYSDNQGRPTLRLERYIKNYNDSIPYSALPWSLKDVWAANRTQTTAERVEENVRYTRLAFPVKEGKLWNGNAQNVYGEMNCSYLFFDQPRTIAGVTFDSVLQVNQQNLENIIVKKYSTEKYARRTGLVFKQVIDVESQPNSDWYNTTLFPFGNDSLAAFFAKPVLQRVTSGFQYFYIYNSSGIE